MDAFPDDFQKTVSEKRKKRKTDMDQKEAITLKRLRKEIFDAICDGSEYIFSFPLEAEFRSSSMVPFLEEIAAALPDVVFYMCIIDRRTDAIVWHKGRKACDTREYKIVLTEDWI